jgi:GNAT superfamily N-acetyltransferase
MTPQIRRIRLDEWEESRSLRLRALVEAPTAYGSTLAEEQNYSEEVWRERCLRASAGCDSATFIAEHERLWVGSVTGLATQDNSKNAGALLVAMFVCSAVRRRGVGVALVEALSNWARNCGANQVTLWVTSSNSPAVALYERCCFRYTGVTKPLAHTPTLTEQEMIRHLR